MTRVSISVVVINYIIHNDLLYDTEERIQLKYYKSSKFMFRNLKSYRRGTDYIYFCSIATFLS